MGKLNLFLSPLPAQTHFSVTKTEDLRRFSKRKFNVTLTFSEKF